MPKLSQVTKSYAARAVIAGIEKRWRAGAALRVDGKTRSREDLVALFQSQLDALDAIRVARAALRVAVARERVIARRVAREIPKLRAAVQNDFGIGRDVLADFGWVPPKKPGPKTAEAKRAGAEKLRATRKARGTMGKRQRQRA